MAGPQHSFLKNVLTDRTNIAFVCILAMFIGFLAAPALISMAMIGYGINGLVGVHPRRWLSNRWWLAGAAWIAAYAISYFWSNDKGMCLAAVQIKLPILLLPLAFTYTPRFSAKQVELLILLVGLTMLCGAAYSISFLVRDVKFYMEEYRISHTLPTPCRNDHLCFSISIVLYMVWAIYSWPVLRPAAKWLTGIVIGLLSIFLHVLAAKSGLLSFYLFLVCGVFYLLFSRQKILGLMLVVAIPLFVFFALKYIPTFSLRKNYVHFSLEMLRSGDRSGNYGDIGRLMSYKLGMYLIEQHPIAGVGAGDLMTEMKKGYDKFYPQVADRDRLVPHNQVIIVGASVGIPAMLVFAVWLFMPLVWLRRNRQSFYFLVVWLISFVFCMIDTALEIQYGVFTGIFFLLLMKEELPQFAARKDRLPAAMLKG